jgi:hypothetical protein
MPAGSLPASPDAAGDIAASIALDLEDLALGGGADCIGALTCGRRSSFSYRRLPEPRLRLTVQKLDDSFFGTLRIDPLAIYFPSLKGIVDF